MTFDPIEMLRILSKHEVDHVVIGGIAAAAHGSPTSTVDLDICYERSRSNLARLAAALQELQAELRGVEEAVPFLLEAETLHAGENFTLKTALGDLDLLGTPSGTGGYEDLVRTSARVELGDLSVTIASLDDLIRMKRSTGRVKDRIELEILGALREELEER